MKFETTACAAKALEAAKGLIDEKSMRELFRKIDENSLGKKYEEAVAEVLTKTVAAEKYLAVKRRRDALFNFQASQSIRQFAGSWNDPVAALESVLLGKESRGQGARVSAATYREGLQATLRGQLYTDLKREGVFGLWKSGVLNDQIARAKYKLSVEKAGRPDLWERLPYAKEPIREEALKIAAILEKQQEAMRSRQAGVGAIIKERPGFVASQSHDRSKILSATGKRLPADDPANFKAYAEDLGKWIDMEGTRENLRALGKLKEADELDPAKFLRSLYEVFTTGVRKDANGQVRGAGNLADQATAGRIIEFKGPDEWTAYNAKYGAGGLTESVDAMMRDTAHTVSSLKFFGPGGLETLQKVRQKLALDAREAGKLELANKLQSEGRKLESLWDRFSGVKGIPENEKLAEWEAGIKTWNRMRLLGMAFFANLNDMTSFMMQNRWSGIHFVRAAAEPITAFAQRLTGKELETFVTEMGVGIEGAFSHHYSMLDLQEVGPGKRLNQLNDLFSKVNLVTPWTNLLKSSYVRLLSNKLATIAGTEFDKLGTYERLMLQDYKVNAAEWDIIRNHTVATPEGSQYLHIGPEKIADVPDDVFASLLQSEGKKASPRAIAERRADLETRLRMIFVDGADYAAVTPDARTMHMSSLGTQAGTPMAAFINTTMQFKGFLVAWLQKTMGRAYQTGLVTGGRAGALSNAAQVFGASSALGVGTYLLSTLAKGRVFDWENMDQKDYAKLAVAGINYGGGLGILTDMFFNTAYLEGRSAQAGIGGPTLDAAVMKPMQLMSKAMAGDDISAESMRWARSLVPGQNLFYVRPLVDYAFFYGLQEWANPGTLKRLEQKARQDGQEYLFPPSENALGQ